jgi:hypothetical protein
MLEGNGVSIKVSFGPSVSLPIYRRDAVVENCRKDAPRSVELQNLRNRNYC